MSDVQEIYAILLGRRYQEQLFSDLGEAKKDGKSNMRAFCPFCQPHGSDGRGHFSYSLTKPLWRCFSCHKEEETAGDWIGYLEARKGLAFKEALLFLAQAAGVELEGLEQDKARYQAYTRRADLLEAAQDYFRKSLAAHDNKPAHPVLTYLLERGYSVEDIAEMELGAYVDTPGLQRHLQELGYPEREIRDSGLFSKGFGQDYQLTLLWRDPAGRPMGVVTRCILPPEQIKAKGLHKYSYSTGMEKDKGLIGLTTARGAKEIVLVEGHLDALYLSSKGLAVVGLGGTSISAAQIKALQDNGTKELLLALDMDQPGQQATERMIQGLRPSSLRPYVVTLPEGYNDPDELVRKRGLEAFRECLAKAERWPKWMARRLCSRHDLQTDRGRDQALEEGLALYAEMDDPVWKKDVLQALKQATGLADEEIGPRLEEQELRASKKRAEQILQATLRSIQQKASEGDVFGAELDLSQGLQALQASRGVQAPEPYLLEDLEEDVLHIRDGLSTGYEELDALIKIPQGQLTFVAGRTGHGKTTMMLNMLLNMARSYPDSSFSFFSYEEAKSRLALKLIMLLAGQELHSSQNLEAYIGYMRTKRGQNEQIEKAIQEYRELTSSGRLWLSDQTLSAEDLAASIVYASKRSQPGAVFVDYIQNVYPRQSSQASQRYLVVKESCRLMRETAVSLELPIILGAQLNRASTGRSDKKPLLTDLRESGDIEQEANLVLGLYNVAEAKREEEGTPAAAKGDADLQVHILKNRAGISGRWITLAFDGPRLRIKNKGSSGSSLY